MAPSFNYASGDSGGALPNGRHWRSLCQVNCDGTNTGYWLLFDEVHANTPGDSVNILLHPNSDDVVTDVANTQYTWRIGSFNTANTDFDTETWNDDLDVRNTDNNVHLRIVLATPPNSASIEKGLLAHLNFRSFVGQYLDSVYPTDSSGFLTR